MSSPEQASSSDATSTTTSSTLTPSPLSPLAGGGNTPEEFRGLYDWEEQIGSGHFSVVRRGEHAITKDNVAIKITDKRKVDPKSLEALHNEVRVLKLTVHPNVIRLYQVIETEKRLSLVIEYAEGGDLQSFISNHGRMNESRARKIFLQLAKAVSFIHEQNVVHRDLKAENVVLTDVHAHVVKITDFGLSNSFKKGHKMNTMCGSMAYAAPEVLLQDSYDGMAIDVWSLGVILFLIVSGRLPFHEANESATLVKILDNSYEMPYDLISLAAQELIQDMLCKDPLLRCKSKSICSKRWLKENGSDDTKEEQSEKEEQETQPTFKRQDSQPLRGNLAKRPVPRTTSATLSPPTPQHLKLARRHTVKPREHNFVLNQMEKLGLDKQKTLKSLEADAYDFLTATYNILLEHNHRIQRGSSVKKKLAGDDDDPNTMTTVDGSLAASPTTAEESPPSSPEGAEQTGGASPSKDDDITLLSKAERKQKQKVEKKAEKERKKQEKKAERELVRQGKAQKKNQKKILKEQNAINKKKGKAPE